MTSLARALLATLLLACLPAGASAGPRALVRNGELDTAREAVVALVHTGTGVGCTGTLIAPRVVVTAAHCLQDEPMLVLVGNDPSKSSGYFITVEQVPHPAWDRVTERNDVAVLLLDQPATQVQPMALGRAPLGDANEGGAVTVVGYGHIDFAEGNHLRRAGTARIVHVGPTAFRTEPAPAQVCQGDSGGAALLQVEGREVLVGITSTGEQTCSDWASFMRIDAYTADFLDPFVRGLDGAAPGERCFPGTVCLEGPCVPAPDEPALSFCTRPCAANADCPGGLVCASEQRQCVHPAPSPGALGGTCQHDAQCASGWCAGMKDGAPGACTRHCSSTDPTSCPADFACVKEDVGGARFELCRATTPSCGCGAPGGASAGELALALALLAVATRARRRG